MKQEPIMDLGLPEGMDMVNNLDSLEITRRWFSWKIIAMTLFAVVWDGFLVFWYSMATQSGSAIMLLFPLVHVAVGMGLTYYVLAGYMNKTRIYVDQMQIVIRHGPLPWFGNRTVDAGEVKQIYVKEHVSRSRRGGATVTFAVHMLTHGQRNVKLLSGLPNSEQALFIEQEIEKFLRIQDVPVRGQLGRRDTW